MASPVDPLQLVVRAAADPEHDPLVLSGTIQLVDETGIPVDYISGALLQQTMQQVYKRAHGPINEERRRRFEAIADWTLSPELARELAVAIVGPLMDGLCGPDAPLVHLGCVVSRRGLAPMQPELWWTPDAIRRLNQANPQHGKDTDYPSISKIVAYANFNCYHFTSGSIARRDLPLERGGHLYRAHGNALERIVRALLMTLLD